MLPSPSEYTVVAIEAALKAGELLSKGFGTTFQIESKGLTHDIVTEYDKLSEKSIFSAIGSRFPKHTFLSEESGASGPPSDEVLWVIDPLDGTVNFAREIPFFSVSIAATQEGRLLSGVVYQPMTRELFIAEKGKGAYKNGKRLHVSAIKKVQKAVMATGFPYNVSENPLHCIDRFAALLKLGVPIRRLGSAALDLCYVAAGHFDAFWEVGLNPWDIAAGKLIVEEAGGKVTHYDGSKHQLFPYSSLLATNGLLHNDMVEMLKGDISDAS